MGTTNYFDTFIEVADDCPADVGTAPQVKSDTKTVAYLQYEMLADAPYKHTSDDVLFEVYASRQGIADSDKPAAREAFFAKDQPCLRASALGKRYGWGIKSDSEGRVALVAVDSEEYRRLVADDAISRTKAMRSKRA